MDFKRFSDERLSSHLAGVLAEQERRARLARTVTEVARMAEQYVNDGGDKAEILEALNPKETETTDE